MSFMANLSTATQQLEKLIELVETEEDTINVIPDFVEVTSTLNEISVSIQQGGVSVREALIERRAYFYICKAWALCCWSGTPDVPSPAESAGPARNAVFQALYSLTAGFPEIIDEIGWQIITQAVDSTVADETQILMLKLVRNVSIESEENREYFCWTLGLLDYLTELIIRNKPSNEYMREWCATIKALLLNDDPRVPYNRSAERKKAVAKCGVLPILAGHLSTPKYADDAGTLNAIIIFLGTMAISEDLCFQIDNGNVLPGINACMKTHFKNKTVLRNAIALLRYLCCEPGIREKSSSYPFMKWVMEALFYYKRSPDVVDVATCCLGFLTLQNACQTTTFLKRQGLQLIRNTMEDYSGDLSILKASCFLLRNVCENSSSEDKREFVDLEYPALFKQLLKDAPDLTEFYLTPLLKELGLYDLLCKAVEEEMEEMEDAEGSFEDNNMMDDDSKMYDFLKRDPNGDDFIDDAM